MWQFTDDCISFFHVTAVDMQVESIPEGLMCPISGEVFVDPVQAPDGYT